MILYAAPGNATQRVLWALQYKQASFQIVDALPLKANGTYAAINPFGYVPSLEVDGVYFGESMAIVEYLEETFPDPLLLPGSPVLRAQIRAVCEQINSTVHPAQNHSVLNFLRPDLTPESMKTVRAQWLQHSLSMLNSQLWQASAFAVGGEFSLADIFVAVIYKRALSQGVLPEMLSDYAQHLAFLLSDIRIQNSAPF